MLTTRSSSSRSEEVWKTLNVSDSVSSRPNARTYENLGITSSGLSPQERSARVKGTSDFSIKRSGFFGRHLRSFSNSLPQFVHSAGKKYSERETSARGRYSMQGFEHIKRLFAFLSRYVWRNRRQVVILLGCILTLTLFYITPMHDIYKRHPQLGGGKKFVLILAANEGGGVMEWKGAREWAIERDSVKNKRGYAKRWGYELEIVDMAIKKRYAHEWRESWEKVDTIRRCLREYPDAQWFWWLDLNTFIMEPSYSLQKHIFNDLSRNTYRNINQYNPLNITHPLNEVYLDELSKALEGDEAPDSIDIIVPQDCSGFNLGSFFVRRSTWTDRLLDMWWDPVHYEQKHMSWEHKEQDAFEYLYQNQPWIRPHTAFISQRKICSFPSGACGKNDPGIHYDEKDRDFVVSMAGCSWGRDCWGEMYAYRELSNKLNRTLWEMFKDGLEKIFNNIVAKKS